jgi:integrase/recombinase XerD
LEVTAVSAHAIDTRPVWTPQTADPTQLLVAGFQAQYRNHTAAAIHTDLKHYVGWLMSHDLPLLSVQRPHLELYLRHLEMWISTRTGRPYRPATISRMFGTVKLLYVYAVEEEYLMKDPAARIKRPPVPEDDQGRHFLTPLEFAAVLHMSRRRAKDHLLVGLLGMMGLRISEATQLDVESLGVDGGYETIHFIGKGAKPATMPLPVPVVRAVHAVVGDRTTGPLLTTRTGERMDRACAARILTRLGRDAGLEKRITPHALRRSFITCGLLSGVPLRDMQAAARHADPKQTVAYDRMANGYDRHAAHRVAGFLAGMAR